MPQRKRRPRMNRHFKIDHGLAVPDRDEYLALLREPRTTIDVAHAWLAAKGYRDFSRSAVARHRRHYLERREADEAALRQAQAFARLATSPGAPDFTAGAVLQAEHLMFERVWQLKDETRASDDGPLKPEELQSFLEAISALIQTRRQLLDLQRAIGSPENSAADGTATPAPDAMPAPDAPPAADEPRFETIAREVRRLIGVPPGAPPAPTPPAPTPEEEHEATLKRICEILNYPYPPPGAKGARAPEDPCTN